MTNPVVFDIETKNTFFDVGRDNFNALNVSMICAYSYTDNTYRSFEEHQIKEAEEFFKAANPIIGFSISRFDIPVMDRYFSFDFFSTPRVDLLDEIELATGRRISLNLLAQANLGISKTGHGLEAPILYRQGKIEELREYCLQDVKITKELYDLAKAQKFLLVPKKDSEEIQKVPLFENMLF